MPKVKPIAPPGTRTRSTFNITLKTTPKTLAELNALPPLPFRNPYLIPWEDPPDAPGRPYRTNAADIHSHVLPNLDDGAICMEESLELLRLDREEGVRTVFATPHYGKENGFAPTTADTFTVFNRLQAAAKKTYPEIELYFGTEWYCSENIVERIRSKEAWPMMPSDWYMVEFMEWRGNTEPAETILRRLKKMKDSHIKTILAHAERYTALQEDRDLAKRICDMGVLLQVNAFDLQMNTNEDTRNLAQWMAKEHLISFLGSDMHGIRPGRRFPKMRKGIRWLYENVGEDYANDVVRRNAEKYLGIPKLREETGMSNEIQQE